MRIAALLILAGIAYGQKDDDPEKTFGVYNGRWWRDAPRVMRYGYVMGYHDNPCLPNENSLAGVTYQEVVEALDKLYSEPANAPIPLPNAFTILNHKIKGASKPEIEELLEHVREYVKKELRKDAEKKKASGDK